MAVRTALRGTSTMAVRTALRGRVALIRIVNPPVNSLSHAVRLGISDGLDQAEAANAAAVVISGDAATFPAGADIAEFATGGERKAPMLPEIITRLSELRLHTIASLHGTALGGGMELSLACQYRLINDRGRVGLPEVHLGLIPGAGGTQLLPRLVGPEMAINLMASGRMITAKEALLANLVDEVVPSSSEQAPAETMSERGYAFATSLLGRPVDTSRITSLRAVPAPAEAGFFDLSRKRLSKASRGEVAPAAVVDAVEVAASGIGFEAGLAKEMQIFGQLAAGGQASAMQHVFSAERMISKIKGLPKDAMAATVKEVAVIGSGTMGGGIAMCFAQAGYKVTILDQSAEALERGVALIRSNWEASAKKGKLNADRVNQLMAAIQPTTSFDDAGIRGADLVVEAAFERMAIKKEIFAKLDAVCKAGAVLATNTSTLDVDEIASATQRPADVVGMHFFSPANVMPLLENVQGQASSQRALATAMAVGKRIKKKAVLAKNCFGFIGNRMLEPYLREALYMLEEGATPEVVDTPLREFGLAMGPFQMSDLAGNDIGYNIRRDFGWAEPGALGSERYWGGLADALVESGRLGQKTKRGWYDYSAGRTPVVDPEVDALIAAHSTAVGCTRRVILAQEVVDRTLLALVNEGFKIVEEGIAQRESDTDIVFIYGYGFPRATGGPLYWARHLREGGLSKVVDDLRHYAELHPNVSHWQPSELLLSEAQSQKNGA